MPDAPGHDGQRDGDDQKKADKDRHDDAGHVQKAEAKRHEAHDEGGDHDTGNSACAAKNGNTAENDHGDNLQLPALSNRRSGRSQP
ncbi:hypothetical protein D3C87_2051870 [compost metagenome]